MKKILGMTLFLLMVFSLINVSFATYLGGTSYGYVEKEIYGNLNSNQTIVLIVGVHPQENGIHTAIANALAGKSENLSKRYVIYKVHVTQNANDYSAGRMNGQLLAQQFVVPDVSSEKPMLVVDNHENHGSNSGYTYYRFFYPISNTEITKIYTNQIISAMPLPVYYPPNPTSTKYVTVPIANKGIPTIIYETYISDSAAKKTSDANALIDALDKKVINIPTVKSNPSGGLFNTPKIVTLTISKNGTIYYTTDGTTPTNESNEYTDPISISSTTTLKFIGVDDEGKESPIYTQTYTIDRTVPTLISTNPKNGAIKVSRTGTISIKFSENVKTSINWSKVVIKNRFGRTVSRSKWVSGNTLYIKTYKRTRYSYYTVYIPASAVKDNAGNNLATSYVFKFKTGKY
ncbi:MAG: chitobiase/beta-hexosaminidase C-terminal domain-containing protein [Methanobacterium sp.]|nr:chitobiase/beta-hexosaminidase C-terminal domain-containing protein [Methanobacterium sp.]